MWNAGFRRARSVISGLFLIAVIVRLAGAEASDELLRLRQQVPALHAAGKYQQAIPIAERLLARAEQVFKDQPNYLSIFLNDLANVYHSQSRYAEAELLYKRAL